MSHRTNLREYLLERRIEPIVSVPIVLTKPIDKEYGQSFGQDFSLPGIPSFYNQWDMDGHNGIDFPAPIGTDVVAPCDLWIDNYIPNETYGNNLWAYTREFKVGFNIYRLEMVFSHLSEAVVVHQNVTRGVVIAKSGNSGYPRTSTAPHLHWGCRVQRKASGGWEAFGADNRYRGYFNQYLITQDMLKLIKEVDSNNIYAVDEVGNVRHKICNESTLKQGHLTKLWDMEKIKSVSTVKDYESGSEIMMTYMDNE